LTTPKEADVKIEPIIPTIVKQISKITKTQVKFYINYI